MNYRLIAITHGDAAPLEATLASFDANVTPEPTERILVWDGWKGRFDAQPILDFDTMICAEPAEGFCPAVEEAWSEARRPGVDYVFWLEHDFEFLRRVDLAELAAAIDEFDLAQMSLMRNAENAIEVDAGGVIAALENRGERFTHHDGWKEHSAYWTTNPSLIPVSTFVLHDWPSGPECEGKFGLKMKAESRLMGIWGKGDPWVQHTGARTGFGY